MFRRFSHQGFYTKQSTDRTCDHHLHVCGRKRKQTEKGKEKGETETQRMHERRRKERHDISARSEINDRNERNEGIGASAMLKKQKYPWSQRPIPLRRQVKTVTGGSWQWCRDERVPRRGRPSNAPQTTARQSTIFFLSASGGTCYGHRAKLINIRE